MPSFTVALMRQEFSPLGIGISEALPTNTDSDFATASELLLKQLTAREDQGTVE